MNAPELFTLPEAADTLRISKSYLYKLVEAREIPFFRIGRRIVFKPEDLNAWLEHRYMPVAGGVR